MAVEVYIVTINVTRGSEMKCKTCGKEMGEYCGKRKFCSGACKAKDYRERRDAKDNK